jgi:uncharacterized protein (TIGR02001 family)
MALTKKIAAALVGGLALCAAAAPASAEEDKFGYTWTITAASDYMFRGVSFTSSDPTVNSYLEFTYGIGYVGFWTSNIDTCDDPGCLGSWEQDIYLGIRPVTGPVSWDMGALYYWYDVKNGSSSDADYFEFKVSGTVTPIENLSLTGTVYYTPDQDLASPENVSVEGTIAYTLPKMGVFTPTISGQVGFSSAETNEFYGTDTVASPAGLFGYWNGDDQYVYWNAGLKLAVEKITIDLRYWDTNIPDDVAGVVKNSDERFLASIAVTLP